jgi:small-conductance mechanosensitive channel
MLISIGEWQIWNRISPAAVIMTAVLLIMASVLIFWLGKMIRRGLTRIQSPLKLDYETVLIITRVMSGALWALTALLVLDLWGVGLGGAWTLVASAIAVIGVGFLATWTMVSNSTASLFLSLWRPFQFGQTVEILPENLRGRVIDRNLMFTTLREDGGAIIQIPNNLFFQKMFRVTGRAERSLFESLEHEKAALSDAQYREQSAEVASPPSTNGL